MIENHIIFFLYTIIFIQSTIGYGYIFSKIIDKQVLQNNLGYIGLLGFFFISLISIFTSFFFAHNYLHNSTLHFVGLIASIIFFYNSTKLNELKYLLILTCILFIGLYVYKNHDDFPYYHLTYALNLSENQFLVGMGNFSHGYRTFSSLFYFHSILYMPFIEFYLFHSGPFFILLFFNFIVLSKLKKNFSSDQINFIFYFLLLSLLFINIAFYRIAEHGTDRSAQILLILIFSIFFEILYLEKKNEIIFQKLKILLILVFLASSMKAIYYLYIILIPILFVKKKLFSVFFQKKNLVMLSFVFSSLFLNLSINYLNTGCFLYPAEKTCIIKQEWSIPKKEVKEMSLHYEWWSKAGGGPGYKSNIKKEVYVENFNWINNWVKRHFFNKVSDTLLGIIFISLFVLLTFKYFSNNEKYKRIKVHKLIFLIPILFLLEWFFNHPSMRYGGYVLFAIPIFLATSLIIQKYNIKKIVMYKILIFFIIISLVSYNIRNISRISKERNIYSYDLLNSPFFFIEDVNSEIILDKNGYKIYSTKKNKMCWASKTPCAYNRNLDLGNFLWMGMIFRNDK